MVYDLNLIRVMAYDIAKKLPELYKINNSPGCLVDVPLNRYLHDTDILVQHIVNLILDADNDAEIHVIDDYFFNDGSIVGGYYELGNRFHIVVNVNHNLCWTRFALIKELCSLYVNHYGRKKGAEDLQTSNDYEKSVVNSFIERDKIKNGELNPCDIDSDTFAIFLATELMIPPLSRKYTDALLERVEREEMTINDVAQSLSIPEFMLKKIVELGYYKESCEYYFTQTTASTNSVLEENFE